MDATANTPFKLPLWSDWTVRVKGSTPQPPCSTCGQQVPPLKSLAITSLMKWLRSSRLQHELPRVLQDNHIPPVLYLDVARQLAAHKQWTALRGLIAAWPYEQFQLHQVLMASCCCTNCWLSYLESEDVDDLEREGGDTERQLFRKIFKHVLDGYFMAVKGTLENVAGAGACIRVLDLTLDSSQDVRGFLWEEEFRRLGRRVIKILDVCILAALHKRNRNVLVARSNHQESTAGDAGGVYSTYDERDSSAFNADDIAAPVDTWNPGAGASAASWAAVNGCADFKVSYWSPEFGSGSASSNTVSAQQPVYTAAAAVSSDGAYSGGVSDEIGVWNGDAIDSSHFGAELPQFRIVIDAAISEKSTDILAWIRQRYDDFSPACSPVRIDIRYLEVSMHQESKLGSLIGRLPEHVIGLKLAEICEERSTVSVASYLPRFCQLRFLDLGSCAFDLTSSSSSYSGENVAELMAESLQQLRHLERLSLAHNCLSDFLECLLEQLESNLILLDLSSCCLTDADLEYLSDSRHCRSLRSLSLASNELSCKWSSLQRLVRRMGAGRLRVLDLSSNEFVESQLLHLAGSATEPPLAGLALLDLSWHQLRWPALVDVLRTVSASSHLRTVCLSTPVDMDENGYSEPESWQDFVDFTAKLVAEQRHPTAHPLQLHWCLM